MRCRGIASRIRRRTGPPRRSPCAGAMRSRPWSSSSPRRRFGIRGGSSSERWVTQGGSTGPTCCQPPAFGSVKPPNRQTSPPEEDRRPHGGFRPTQGRFPTSAKAGLEAAQARRSSRVTAPRAATRWARCSTRERPNGRGAASPSPRAPRTPGSTSHRPFLRRAGWDRRWHPAIRRRRRSDRRGSMLAAFHVDRRFGSPTAPKAGRGTQREPTRQEDGRGHGGEGVATHAAGSGCPAEARRSCPQRSARRGDRST